MAKKTQPAGSKTHWKLPVNIARLNDLLTYNQSTGVFTWKLPRRCIRAGSAAGTINHYGYVVIKIDGLTYKAHRLAWMWATGRFSDLEIDHINRIRSDNRLSNLREATSSQNKHNASMRTDNTSGLKGVSYSADRRKFVAQISVNGKNQNLGRFSTDQEAAAAYRNAALRLHGEFASAGGAQ